MASKGNRMSRIQGDQMGFAQSLSLAVEDGYRWKTAAFVSAQNPERTNGRKP